jgi:amidase
MTEPTTMTAVELASAIRERRMSSTEIVEAHLSRIERGNPALNAVITLDAAGALRQAREVDDLIARGDVDPVSLPLLGVPLTLKDCHETAGMRTTSGYPPLSGHIPARDGTVSARLKAAGAIVMGKTNVSELLADAQSSNPIFGRANNPWNLERTPGGSSGGAAAAVACGMTPLEIGSDIGGSIRMPAHCCGIYGLKPTEHRVSNYGHIPDLPQHPRTTRVMNAIGPMARSVDDLSLAFRIIAGPDGFDLDVPPVPVSVVPDLSLASLRLAWAGSFPGLPIASDIRNAIARLAVDLDGAGALVEETLPGLSFDEQLETRMKLREIVRMLIDVPPAGPPSALDYFETLDRRDGFIRAWEQFFDDWDALICPVMMTTAFPHCERDTPVAVDGEPYDYMMVAGYCRPFNLTGHPVVTIPIGLDGDGLPIGVQIAGKRWHDERLLGIAKAVTSIVGPLSQPDAPFAR